MSEQAPERTAPRGKGNIFTNKIGPLPMWAWLGISLAILLGWAYFQNKKGGSQQGPTSTVGAGQVPQFVNQTFTNVGPPGAEDHDRDDRKRKKQGDPCPGDMYWDPDANGGRGKCVPEHKEKQHHGGKHHKGDDGGDH